MKTPMARSRTVVTRVSCRLKRYVMRQVKQTGMSQVDFYDVILRGFLLWREAGYPGATRRPWEEPRAPSKRKQARVVRKLMEWQPFYGDNRWYCSLCGDRESRDWQAGYRHLQEEHPAKLSGALNNG